MTEVVAWHTGALGDVILAIPALRFLRRVAAHGRARLTLLATPERGDLLRRGAACHEARDGTAADLAALFTAGGSPPEWLAERLSGETLVALFFRGADDLARNLARHAGRVVVIDPRPTDGSALHCSDHLVLEAARALRLRLALPAVPRLRVDATAREAAQRLASRAGVVAGSDVLVLAPGAGGEAKRWPIEGFIEVARRARAACGWAPVAVLGPVERERHPDFGARFARAGIAVIEAPPLPALAALLASARAVLANDSGPAHLAAAVGAPTVALFGPASNAVQFAPRGGLTRPIVAASLADLPPERVCEALWSVQDARGVP